MPRVLEDPPKNTTRHSEHSNKHTNVQAMMDPDIAAGRK